MWLVGYLSQVKYTLVLFALTRLPGMVRPRLFMIALVILVYHFLLSHVFFGLISPLGLRDIVQKDLCCFCFCA